jgi:hypothetical protein
VFVKTRDAERTRVCLIVLRIEGRGETGRDRGHEEGQRWDDESCELTRQGIRERDFLYSSTNCDLRVTSRMRRLQGIMK